MEGRGGPNLRLAEELEKRDLMRRKKPCLKVESGREV